MRVAVRVGSPEGTHITCMVKWGEVLHRSTSLSWSGFIRVFQPSDMLTRGPSDEIREFIRWVGETMQAQRIEPLCTKRIALHKDVPR